ncbi:hypothetical protein V5738_12570 [Salinisphaera sp. SPP-AMP-43]|uniref:hypothetical protein n=1 Tax=Salinisphaera sp. SPP-AMP-43 TaxID=3121288 RepID=UPI003C6E9B85
MPELYLPAMPPLGLIQWLRESWHRRTCRQRLATLLDQDDRQLRDLGLTRPGIQHALRRADDPCRWLVETMHESEHREDR